MVQLYNQQKIMLARLRLADSFAVFAEPGCGKTLPALIRLAELFKAGKIRSALVVAPKSALGAWNRDLEKMDGPDADRIRTCADFVNYDRVWRGRYNGPYDCIILDESHNVKNRNSRRGRFLLKLACQAKYRYILTGTPIANGSLEDIWSQFTFLNPYIRRGYVYGNIWKQEWEERTPGAIYNGSYGDFLDQYCLLNQYHKPYRYTNVRELQEIIEKYSYRITKAECLDLPEMLPDEIIDADCKEPKLYKTLATESALIEYDIIADNPLSRMTKLRQLCSGHITTEDGTVPCKCEKIDLLDEIIDRYPEDRKLVIFANFRYSIQQIRALLDKKKISYVVLDGEQKDKQIWRKFQTDPGIRIILCQYQSANAGIDLYAADTEIFYEPTTQSVILEQARDRIHRQGQTRPCSYVHLITKGTVEEAIYHSLERYEDFSKKLFVEYISNYQKSFTHGGRK